MFPDSRVLGALNHTLALFTNHVRSQGGPYEFVSVPNYAGELLEWFGWTLSTGLAPPAVLFLVWTGANLMPRAIRYHRWSVGGVCPVWACRDGALAWFGWNRAMTSKWVRMVPGCWCGNLPGPWWRCSFKSR